MTTALTLHSFASRARMFVLAGSIALATVLPTVGLVSADGGVPTPPASAPVLTRAEAFEVDPAGGLIDIQAVVVAGESGAPLLDEPTTDADVLTSLPTGTTVLLRIDMVDSVAADDDSTRFWPVTVGGSDGWIDGRSLMSPEDFAARSATSSSDGSDGSSTQATSRQPFDFTGDMNGATAQVDADGQGLTMRAEPSASSDAVTTLSEGTIVSLRIADVDTVYDTAGTRWWPVSHDGNDGWVSGFYLITPGSTPQSGNTPSTSTPEKPTTPSGDYTYIPGDWAVVRTANSGRANLYASADAGSAVNSTIPHMALVQVIAQANGGWYEVRWDGNQGFISGDLLTAGTAPRRADGAVETAPTPTPAPVSTEEASELPTDPMTAGDVVRIDSDSGAGVNVRETAGTDAKAVGFLADGAQVTIIAGPTAATNGTNWYQVRTDDGTEGWVRSDLLTTVVANPDSTTEATTDQSSSGFILPLKGYRFTQDYGCSSLGFYGYDSNWGCAVHDGLDLAAPQGTPLVAVANGTVVVAGWCDCGLGYYVEIDHGNGIHSVYGHMVGQPSVSVGQKVSQGDQIGKVGSTGLSTGPHVHFMVRENGVTVDPKNYLPPVRENAN